MLNHIFGPDLVLRTNLAITRLLMIPRPRLYIMIFWPDDVPAIQSTLQPRLLPGTVVVTIAEV